MNESDARGEDDLDRREAEVMCFRQRLKVSMVGDVRIARGSEYINKTQMLREQRNLFPGNWVCLTDLISGKKIMLFPKHLSLIYFVPPLHDDVID